MHLADACIQNDLQYIQAIHYLFIWSGCVFPENWTHDLNAMLYHWATGTPVTSVIL